MVRPALWPLQFRRRVIGFAAFKEVVRQLKSDVAPAAKPADDQAIASAYLSRPTFAISLEMICINIQPYGTQRRSRATS
jgi:hypothetical protein